SKINLVYSVISSASERVLARTDEVSADLTGVLIDTLNGTATLITRSLPDLQAAHQQAVDAAATIRELDATLGMMNISFSEESFGTASLEAQMRDFANQTAMVAALGADVLNTTQELLLNITTALEDMAGTVSANSSTGQRIAFLRAHVDDYNETFLNESRKLIDVSNLSSSLTTMRTSFGDLNAELGSTRERLDVASAARDDVRASLQAVAGLLDSVVMQADSVIGVMGSIAGAIDDIQITNVQSIVMPVRTRVKPVVEEKTHLSYIFPSLIALVVMFVAILLATSMTLLEKKSRAFFRNYITPTGPFVSLVGMFLTMMILLIVQVVIIIALSHWLYQESVTQAIIPLLLTLLLSSSMFTLCGMLVGNIFNSEDTATLGAISLSSVFLLLSSLILPIESMPDVIANLSHFNPFVLTDTLLKKSIIFGKGLDSMATELQAVGWYIVVLVVLVAMAAYLSYTRLPERAILRRRVRIMREKGAGSTTEKQGSHPASDAAVSDEAAGGRECSVKAGKRKQSLAVPPLPPLGRKVRHFSSRKLR
ncbi:hypothetical protein COV94_02115, partial [Candidatus Woesearchaeota archaeon CG11_big_fil_rev_8_21_14_0_20_57_5]